MHLSSAFKDMKLKVWDFVLGYSKLPRAPGGRGAERLRPEVQPLTLLCTIFDDIAHEQTITCRQLFAGHVVCFWPVKRKNDNSVKGLNPGV